MLIADAHLDLAYNALRGRDVIRAAAEQTPDADGTPSVGLPDLRAGGVSLICGTIFCEPSIDGKPGYRNSDEAHAAAASQLAWYHEQAAAGLMKLIRTGADVPKIGEANLHTLILLEGADAFRSPADVAPMVEQGLRLVGLAWRRTRYAGGTGEPGPLTPEGVELVRELDRHGVIHDASHLAEESFWQLMHLTRGPVIASHSNCRAIVPGDRHLSDDMIKAIIDRGGVIGINFFDKFLIPPPTLASRRATLDDVIAHIRHISQLGGDVRHVGLGTDMDGGFGAARLPVEIATSADLPKLAEVLARIGLPDEDIARVMGGNWADFFAGHLPR